MTGAVPCHEPEANEARSQPTPHRSNQFLLIRDTPLGKAYVLGTFLTREVTDMGFKVASRVRGLSDEAFREAFGAEEQCRSAMPLTISRIGHDRGRPVP